METEQKLFFPFKPDMDCEKKNLKKKIRTKLKKSVWTLADCEWRGGSEANAPALAVRP